MILYENTKAITRSPDGDIDFFDIVAGVRQGDSLASYMFIIYSVDVLGTLIIWLDFVLRMSNKRKWFYLKKNRSRRYPAETVTDAEKADDFALFANRPTQDKSQLRTLEQVAEGSAST